MGSIRKQTIISSILVYVGFAIGFVNNYFFTRNGSFTPAEYGLTRIFTDFAQNMFAFGSLGVVPIIYKFYPYYKDNLKEKEIDLITWSFFLSIIGFVLVLACGIYFEPYFIEKYQVKSPLILDYYFWMFPFAMGMLFFCVLESFSWALNLSVVSNFLKETGLRLLTAVLIALFYLKLIDFKVFIYLFSIQYLVLFIILLSYLVKSGKLHFPTTVSRVTKKFWKKMVSIQVLVFGGALIAALAATIDSFLIAGMLGLTEVGIFVWAQYAAALIQVPQRSIQAVSIGVLSKAWKDKNFPEINRIYARSCINLLIMALFIFGNIWLNAKEGMIALNIQKAYLDGLGVIFVLGMVRIIDAGTGLNAIVINTSTFWRFDFYSGVVLLALRLPLTYYLIKNYGIIGSAFAELFAYGTYNFIRFEFLRRKFNMQPFTRKTAYTLLLGAAAYAITYFSFDGITGWTGIFLKGGLFSILMISGVFYLDLTPDAQQLYQGWKQKWKQKL